MDNKKEEFKAQFIKITENVAFPKNKTIRMTNTIIVKMKVMENIPGVGLRK